MIKVNKFIYIHITTVILLVLCWFNRQLEMLAVSYAVITLHETAHLIAALAVGLKPSKLIFYPFGVNLRLKSNIVFGLAEEVILYLSGPLFNAAAALAVLPFKNRGAPFLLFYLNNAALFFFNILPILPMDGGMTVKKILLRKIGAAKTDKLLKTVSALSVMLIASAEIYAAACGKFNFSMMFTLLFLTGNLFTNKEKYNMNFVRELAFCDKKNDFEFKKSKVYVVKHGVDYRKLAENFAGEEYCIVFCENEDGKIDKLKTKREIVESLLEKSRAQPGSVKSNQL